jgi:hypothetical protein
MDDAHDRREAYVAVADPRTYPVPQAPPADARSWSAAELGDRMEVVPTAGGGVVVWVRSAAEAANSALRAVVSRIAVPAGYVAVFGHGTGGRAYTDGHWVEPEDLALRLADRFGPGRRYFLVVCEALAGGTRSFAARFQAAAAAESVRASDASVFVDRLRGTVIAAGRRTVPGGVVPEFDLYGQPTGEFREVSGVVSGAVQASPVGEAYPADAQWTHIAEYMVAGQPGAVTPEHAVYVLETLPRSRLERYAALPVLGGELGLQVERGPDALIRGVHLDGVTVSVKEYVDRLMRERVELWRTWAADPMVADIRKAAVQPCVSVVVDRRTGLIAEAHNNLNMSFEDLHPLVRERVRAYMHACEDSGNAYEWGTPYAHPSEPGMHSEVYAVSRLLWAREAAEIPVNEGVFAELRMNNHFPWIGGGKPAPCCANCTHILYDVPCNAGKLSVFRGPADTRWEE